MIVDEIFENIIYPNLKEYLEEHSNYSPYVTKRLPQNSKDFPIVPVKLLPFSNIYNNLSYGEETYPFSISIEVYAIDTEDASKRTICNEVTKWIDTYFKEKYHITIRIELDAPNVDSNVHRNIITVLGTLDTKNGIDKPIIIPR